MSFKSYAPIFHLSTVETSFPIKFSDYLDSCENKKSWPDTTQRFIPNKDHTLGLKQSDTNELYYKIDDNHIVNYFMLFVLDSVENHFMQSARVQIKFNSDPTTNTAQPVWVRVYQHKSYTQFEYASDQKKIHITIAPGTHNLYVKNDKTIKGYLMQSGLEFPEKADGALGIVETTLVKATPEMLKHKLYDTEKLVDLLAPGVRHDVYVVSSTVCILIVVVIFIIFILIAFGIYSLKEEGLFSDTSPLSKKDLRPTFNNTIV